MAKRKDRSERDRAGIGPAPHMARKLVPLNDLDDYDVAEGEPDVRGWDVITLSGRELGEVEDVLVDPDRREVVMLDVALRDAGVHAEVPIRAVQLDRDRQVVLLDSGDLDHGVRHDERARARHDLADERDPGRDYRAARTTSSDMSAARDRGQHDDEVVLERRPYIEEVVVRRRTTDEE
jgi:hypothetical protein